METHGKEVPALPQLGRREIPGSPSKFTEIARKELQICLPKNVLAISVLKSLTPAGATVTCNYCYFRNYVCCKIEGSDATTKILPQ